MKKTIAMLMLLTMLVGIVGLTGCGGNDNGGAQGNFVVPESGFDTTTPVTITFGHTMGANLQAVLQKAITRFNKIYPNITIEHSSKGGWSDINSTINTEINGGNQPNIVYCYPDHVAMYNLAKAVVTLDELIASDIAIGDTGEIIGLTEAQKNDIIKSYYDEGLVYGDNLMYTMPISKSTEVLYYDKTFFEENNLKVPTNWDELWEVCAQIKTLRPKDIPLGYDSEDNWFITMCEQMKSGYTDAAGDDKFLFDNDTNKAFIKQLREYYEKGYFTTQELYGAYTSGLFTNQDTKTSRCYMCIGSTGGASYQIPKTTDADGNTTYAFEVGIAPVPQYDANNKKVISQGPSVCILKDKNTSDQEIIASWLFIKFLTTDVEFQAEFSMVSGYMPVLESVTENETYSKWLATADGSSNLTATVVKVGIEGRDTYYVSPAFNGSTTARSQVGSLLLKCISTQLSNGQSVDDLINKAFSDAIDECEYQAS